MFLLLSIIIQGILGQRRNLEKNFQQDLLITTHTHTAFKPTEVNLCGQIRELLPRTTNHQQTTEYYMYIHVVFT